MRAPAETPQSVLRLHSLAEVADRLGVSIKTVRRILARGDLPAHRIGRLLRVSDDDIERFIAATRTATAGVQM